MEENNELQTPTGEPILQTVAMPADTNPNGDIFGGWIMSQMDLAGGIMAKELAQSRVVTVAAESIRFLRPVHVGDIVCCYGKIIKIGTTSVTINLEIWTKRTAILHHNLEQFQKVTEAAFTYVSVNTDGEKQPITARSV